MSSSGRKRAFIPVVMAFVALPACVRTKSADRTSAPAPPTEAPPIEESPLDSGERTIVDAVAAPATTADAAWAPLARSEIDGPYEDLALDAGRPIYYAAPRSRPRPLRLIGHIHGMCTPPVYSCGRWIGAGTDLGVMVCPTGNARCGESPVGPASWEAPTWPELVATMDAELEASIAKVVAKRPGLLEREGAVLTGYSRGAFAAPAIARRHPRRWPYLVLIEANVGLTKDALVASGVRAVALVAGELGTEIGGMRKTQEDLAGARFPAKLFVMRKTGHPYSDDMEQVMHEALDFVLGDVTTASGESTAR